MGDCCIQFVALPQIGVGGIHVYIDPNVLTGYVHLGYIVTGRCLGTPPPPSSHDMGFIYIPEASSLSPQFANPPHISLPLGFLAFRSES